MAGLMYAHTLETQETKCLLCLHTLPCKTICFLYHVVILLQVLLYFLHYFCCFPHECWCHCLMVLILLETMLQSVQLQDVVQL